MTSVFQVEAPDPDVVEVSVFGPGKGESIVVHLGGGEWIIVDSCIDQASRELAPLAYLRRIGVDAATAVRLVVGTHAHDDHIAGLSQVFRGCRSALFVCSSALTREEFYAETEVDAQIERALRQSIRKEYRNIFEEARIRKKSDGVGAIRRALEHRELLRLGNGARVVALSPSDEAVTRSLTALSTGAARAGGDKRMSRVDPNESAVALWVDVGGTALLLGADLPVGPAGCGWQAILSAFSPEQRASVFKVPHHGAPNAHEPDVWTRLLTDAPVALVTPYRGGARSRPDAADRSRLCALTDDVFLTASPDKTVPSRAVQRTAGTLNQVAHNVRDPWGKIGHVRARSRMAQNKWTIEIFPPAYRMCIGNDTATNLPTPMPLALG